MRAVLATLLTLVLLAGCGGDGEGSTPESGQPVDPSVSIPTPSADLDAAARVGVKYVDAVRRHDAGDVYDLAWTGLRSKETRSEFVDRARFDAVSDARISGVIEVGWDEEGRRLAIVPIIVVASGQPQVGRVLLLRERGEWRYFDLAVPDQLPDLTAERP